METNTIHCGECAEIMRRHIPDNSIDLTVTSPPYDDLREYNGYTFDFELIATELWRVTKLGGVVVWVVGDATVNGSETGTSFRQALWFMKLGFNLHDTMIYYKHAPPLTHNRYEQHFEFMFVLTKGAPSVFNPIKVKKLWVDNRETKGIRRVKDGQVDYGFASKQRHKIKGNVWKYNIGGGHVTKDDVAHQHPAIFPEALARDHIISWSNPGDIVLDPMCGSGTTLKMAVETERQYIGIDISREYVDLATKRVARARVPLPRLTATIHNNKIVAELLPFEQLDLIVPEDAIIIKAQ